MKKKTLSLAVCCIVPCLLGVIFLKQKDDVKSAKADATAVSTVNTVSSDNYTIAKMIEVWRGKTRQEFDEYFKEYVDDRRIIADETGGILSYMPDYVKTEEDPENSRVYYDDGSYYEYDLEGPDSTTVGEMREVLYQILKS